jgi:hypothetical protein
VSFISEQKAAYEYSKSAPRCYNCKDFLKAPPVTKTEGKKKGGKHRCDSGRFSVSPNGLCKKWEHRALSLESQTSPSAGVGNVEMGGSLSSVITGEEC